MYGCNQATITDAAFIHLKGIEELSINGCDQSSITGATFHFLYGIQEFHAYDCCDAVIDAVDAVLRL